MQIDFDIDQMRIDAVKRALRDWSFRKLLWSWLQCSLKRRWP